MRQIAVFVALAALITACAPPYENLSMTPSQGFAQAEDALRRGEYATAVAGFSDYLASGQETFRARAFYQLAQAQYGLENYEAALDTLSDFEEDFPNENGPQVPALRGDIEYAMGRRVDAILEWQTAWERGTNTDRQYLQSRIEEAIDELTPSEASRLAGELTNDDLRAMLGPKGPPPPAGEVAAADAELPASAAASAPAPADERAAEVDEGSQGVNEAAVVAGSAAIGAGELGVDSGEALAPGVRVATLLPLTGPDRAYGQRALNGLRLAFAGYPNSLMVRDSGGQPDLAAQLLTALADDPAVLALIGPLRSNTAAVVAPLSERLQMPTLLLAREEGLAGPYVLQTGTTQAEQMRVLVDHVVNTLKLTRFGVIYPDDAYGRSYMASFRDAAARAGATVEKTNAYRSGQQSFAAQASAVKAWVSGDGVQAIFIPDAAITAIEVARAARSVAPEVTLLGTESWNQPDVIASAGGAIDGALFADSFFAGSPSAVDFATRFRTQFGYEPSGFEAQAYDAGMLVREAIANGARTRGAVLQSLRALASYEGAGSMRSGAQGPQRSLVLLEVRNGRVSTVR